MHEEEIAKLVPMLGEDFASQYVLSKYDLFVLRVNWRSYCSIFGTNKERFDLMFEISNSLALTVEQTLFEACLLRLRRITDPKSGRGGKKSVTIKSFASFLEGEEKTEMNRLVSEAEKKAGFARDWSNKRIAHADFEYRVGRQPLPPASRKKVSDAIDAVAQPIKWVAKNKLDTTLVTIPVPPAENEVWFLRHLFAGQEALAQKEAERKLLISKGKWKEAEDCIVFPDWLQPDAEEYDTEY